MRKSRIRIKGNDRFLMMLCRDARRRWMQYGENRKEAQKDKVCQICRKLEAVEWDHVIPMGSRPRNYADFSSYISRMVQERCQGICKKCHQEKTVKERQTRCKKVV